MCLIASSLGLALFSLEWCFCVDFVGETFEQRNLASSCEWRGISIWEVSLFCLRLAWDTAAGTLLDHRAQRAVYCACRCVPRNLQRIQATNMWNSSMIHYTIGNAIKTFPPKVHNYRINENVDPLLRSTYKERISLRNLIMRLKTIFLVSTTKKTAKKLWKRWQFKSHSGPSPIIMFNTLHSRENFLSSPYLHN